MCLWDISYHLGKGIQKRTDTIYIDCCELGDRYVNNLTKGKVKKHKHTVFFLVCFLVSPNRGLEHIN